jgi:hypothetical protein
MGLYIGLKMRIRELLENFNFKENDYVKQHGDKHELDYDLVEDLVHFMHNDDDVYRRHTFQPIMKCVDNIKSKKPTNSKVFVEAVKECYKLYKKKFPIRELDDELDEETCKKVCVKLHDEVKEHIASGKYKD